jgi:hypothetical protein
MLVDRQLGLLSPDAERPLELHLQQCPADAERARLEALLTAELRRLQGDYPFEIDAAGAVRERLAALGAQSLALDEATDREIVWGSVAAAIAAALMLVPGGRLLALTPQAWGLAEGLAGGVLTAAAGVGRPLLAVLSIPLERIGALVAALVPAAQSATFACATLMAATAAVVVGRDLLRLPGGGETGESGT